MTALDDLGSSISTMTTTPATSSRIARIDVGDAELDRSLKEKAMNSRTTSRTNKHQTPGPPRPSGSVMKKISRRLIAAAVVVAPIALASPAQAAPVQLGASQTADGCTVTMLIPSAIGRDKANQVLVDYPVRVKCDKGRNIRVQQEQYEQDGSKIERVGVAEFNYNFERTDVGQTKYIHATMSRTDSDGSMNEELYQQTRFRVSGNGIGTSYGAWKKSGIRVINW
jgi:hypothetical protein